MIPVVQGYFNVMLGPVDVNGVSLANAFSGTNRFMEITVSNNPPIAPRQQILTTPFAFQSAYAAVAGVASNVASGISITNAVVTGNGGGLTNLTASTPSGSNNTAIGSQALGSNTTGINNTAGGVLALAENTSGSNNTASGFNALQANTTGYNNTANGAQALERNTTGTNNTATGFEALAGNTTGTDNTASGYEALDNNTTGIINTASGDTALRYNTTGSSNTATGFAALYSNTNGFANTATGLEALYHNTSGYQNTANGYQSLFLNATGNDNMASGYQALFYNTTGIQNTGSGDLSLEGNTTGSGNIALGYAAGANISTGSNNIEIGNQGLATDSNTIYLGAQDTQTNTIIAGISGSAITGGLPVYVNSSGQLGNQTLRQTGTNVVGIGGVALSLPCSFSTTSTTLVNAMNLWVTITTGGRPVQLMLVPDQFTNSGTGYYVGNFGNSSSSGQGCDITLLVDNSRTVGAARIAVEANNITTVTVPPSAVQFVDLLASPGIHTYQIQIKNLEGGSSALNNVRLIAYEL